MIDLQVLMDAMVFADPFTIALISLGITAIGAIGSAVSSKKAAEQTQKRTRITRQRAQEQDRRVQRNEFRKRLIQQAQARSAAANAGVSQTSTGVVGSVQSIAGATGQRVADSAQDLTFFGREQDLLSQQAAFESSSRTGNQIQQLGLFGVQNSKQIASIGNTIFGKA